MKEVNMKKNSISISEQTASLQLNNGLRIFVFPNRKAPNVTAQVWMATGSIHEQEYLGCGLSHFLEHMLFSGTEKFPDKMEIADRANRLGARLNAWTSYNHTAYYMEGPSAVWKNLTAMLCDMVSAPLLPEDAFQKEKQVIIRECAMRDDSPETSLFETMLSERFRQYPMRYPVIGLREGIESVNREMMLDYYRKRYSPHRCFVVLTGDVEPEDVFEYVSGLLGNWKRTSLIEPALIVDAPGIFPRHITREFPDPMGRMTMGYLIPGATHEDNPALDALASILGGFESSRILTGLRVRKPVVIDAGAFTYKTSETGVFCISADADPANIPAAADGIRNIIETLKKSPVTQDELERTAHSLRAAHLGIFRSNSLLARAIGQSILNYGCVEPLDHYSAAVERLTAEDIQRAAEKYLRAESVVEVRQLPAAAEKPKKKKQSAAGYKPELTVFPDKQKGLYIADEKSPFAGICLCLHGGEQYETEDTAEYSGLLTDALFDGAGDLSEEDFAWISDKRAIQIDAQSSANGFFLFLDCLKEDLEEGLRLLTLLLADPKFPADAVKRDRDDLIQTLESDRQDPRKAAFALADQLSYEAGSPSGFDFDTLIASLKKATPERLRKFMKQTVLCAPESCIAVYGNVSRKQAETIMEKLRKDIPWTKTKAKPGKNVYRKGTQQVTNILPREQAVPVLSLPCPGLKEDAMYLPLVILTNALTGMSSNLFKTVREKEGLAYYTSFRLSQTIACGHMDFFAGTQPETADHVMKRFKEECQRLASEGLTEEEFNASKVSAEYALSTIFQDMSKYAVYCAGRVFHGADPMVVQDRMDRIRKADRAAVNRVVKKLFSTPDSKEILVTPGISKKK